MTDERQCRWAWWQFVLVVSVDIGEAKFDEEKRDKGKKDDLEEGENVIHGKLATEQWRWKHVFHAGMSLLLECIYHSVMSAHN